MKLLDAVTKHSAYHLLGRMTYIMLLPFLSIYGRRARPRVRLLLVHNKRVLLVKNWLGPQNWALPGGGVARHESERQAVRREIHEELGLEIPEEVLVYIQSVDFGNIRLAPFKASVYGLKLHDVTSPLLTIDTKELLDAQWFAVTHLPPDTSPEIKLICDEFID